MKRSKYMAIWKKHAILREGKRLTVYLCSEGHPTVGIGHLVVPADNLKLGDKITETRCNELFLRDTAVAEKAALKQAKESGVESAEWIAALISVNFQLGTGWTKEFKATWGHIVSKRYDQAIANLRKSKWMKQTPVRVGDFIDAIKVLKLNHERPVAATKTVGGASVAGTSVVASAAVELAETQEMLAPLVEYGDTIRTVFLIVALAGIALAIYGRLDLRRKGKG